MAPGGTSNLHLQRSSCRACEICRPGSVRLGDPARFGTGVMGNPWWSVILFGVILSGSIGISMCLCTCIWCTINAIIMCVYIIIYMCYILLLLLFISVSQGGSLSTDESNRGGQKILGTTWQPLWQQDLKPFSMDSQRSLIWEDII